MSEITEPRPQRKRRWIEDEIGRLDPEKDFARIVQLTTTRLFRPPSLAVIHLSYVIGFVRFAGPPVSARSVDRDDTGYTYTHGWQRADETMVYLFNWIDRGIDSERSQAEARKVQHWHDTVAAKWPMPAHTYEHSAAAFTLLTNRLLTHVIGAKGLSDKERRAQLIHWTKVSEAMGVRNIPETWEGMTALLERYETEGEGFAFSEEGTRLARNLVDQWAERFFPKRLRWLGRWIAVSLIEDHVRVCVRLEKPPALFTWALRRSLRLGIKLQRRLSADPSKVLQFGEFIRSHPDNALRRRASIPEYPPNT